MSYTSSLVLLAQQRTESRNACILDRSEAVVEGGKSAEQ